MYQLFFSCRQLRSPRSMRSGCGTFRMASRSTSSGWRIATSQASAAPQSCPTSVTGAPPM